MNPVFVPPYDRIVAYHLVHADELSYEERPNVDDEAPRLADPPERVDLPPTSVVAVYPMTPLQVRNEGDEELVLFIYDAPPEQARPGSGVRWTRGTRTGERTRSFLSTPSRRAGGRRRRAAQRVST